MGKKASKVTGRILTGAMADHNTFENPNAVKTEDFTDASVTADGLSFTIPACSVISLTVE